jgi:hypothetical protein
MAGASKMVPGAVWLAGALTTVFGSAFLSLGVIGTLDTQVIHSAAGSLAHGIKLSAWLTLWALLGMVGLLGTTVLARRATQLSFPVLAIPGAGIALAASFQLALQQWAAGRMLDYAHDIIGFSILVPELLITLAFGAFAVDLAPDSARPVVRTAGAVVSVATLATLSLNLGGLQNGISADSWLLGLLMAMAAGYALTVLIRLVRLLPR